MKSPSSNFASLALLGVFIIEYALATDESYAIPDIVNNGPSSRGSSTAPFVMPPGCRCKVSGTVNDDRCDQFDCQCQCDLIAGACDINCCCDKECSGEDLSSFSDCLDEGGTSSVVKMCTERPSSLEDVNLRHPLRLGDYPEDKLYGLMCVEHDNSAVQGNFFEDQGYPPASQVFSPGGRGAKQLGFHSYGREATPVKSNAYYQLGETIPAYQQNVSDQQLERAFGGYLVLPSANDGGYCIELNTVAFGKSESSACLKRTYDVAADCEGPLGTARYVSGIFVEETKGSDDALLPIHVNTFTDSKGMVSTGLFSIPQQTKWDNSSSVCTNALKRMVYNVRHNSTSIVGITVDIETLDIEQSTIELLQEFAVNFIPVDVGDSHRSRDKNNMITRVRSGNPGYIFGAPTLGATSPDNNIASTYVIAQKAGFTVMDTGMAGQCSSSSTTGLTVGFAKNIFVGCTQSFTREELKEFCLDPTHQHPMLASQKMNEGHFLYPKWLQAQASQNLLGIFGNSDPLDKRQWIEIESPPFTWSRGFIEADSRCIGTPSRLRYDISWTYVGNVDDPQAKILSAKKSFEEGPPLQHTLPPNEKQPYSFVTTVSWSFLPPKYKLVRNPPPLYIFSVPYDVFYPFQMSNQ